MQRKGEQFEAKKFKLQKAVKGLRADIVGVQTWKKQQVGAVAPPFQAPDGSPIMQAAHKQNNKAHGSS